MNDLQTGDQVIVYFDDFAGTYDAVIVGISPLSIRCDELTDLIFTHGFTVLEKCNV